MADVQMGTKGDLQALFRPRAVAVVGASRRRGTIAGELFHNLLARGFPGAVYPVNPHAAVVQAVRAYPTVQAIPDDVDLAVLTVARDHVLPAIDDCIAKGVKAVVVITAGFAEVGPDGRALQDEMLRRVRAHGIRLVGPNCLGLLNADPAVELNATFAPTWPPAGGVSFSSQSGALGLAVLDYARELGIGVHQFVSVGNRADVSGNDLIAHWGDEPDTKVILLYMEDFGNPRKFMEIAPRVARRKPIVAVKSGRTEAGARAASSHTGALAGMDVAVDALLGQAGVIRTDTIEELFDVAMLLANQPVPGGARVGIITNAGGPGIMASDACETHGLVVPQLADETRAALRAFLPPEASVRNPVDMIASAAASSYEKALRILLADPGIDAVMVLFVPPLVTEAAEVAAAIRRAGADARKPVLTSFLGTHGIPEALSSLREGRYPSYAFPEAGAIALARAVRYGRWLQRPVGTVPVFSDVSPAVARRQLPAATPPEGVWLTPDEVRGMLSAYGVRLPRTVVAATPDEAVAAAAGIAGPVAIKLASPTITHKTDLGGVILGVEGPTAVRAAFATIAERVAARGQSDAMTGVVVQEMVKGGIETFVGVTQAKGFGPIVGFGIGGVSVEVWRDVVFRVPPLSDVDAHEMIQQIRGRALLEGHRGGPMIDKDAVAEVILRVSRLVRDVPEILELDVNPLLAMPKGRPPVALDARIRIGRAGAV